MERIITIDGSGRVVIPKEFRHYLRLHRGSRLRLTSEGGHRLVLEPVEEADAVAEVDGLLVATGTLQGEWLDHRDVREERSRLLRGHEP